MTFVMNMKKRIGNQRGVTLIELLAVIVILGIISAIAVPAVLNNINDAEQAKYDTSVQLLYDAAERYYVKHYDIIRDASEASVTVTIADLVNEGYIKANPNIPSVYGGDTAVTGVTYTIATKVFTLATT